MRVSHRLLHGVLLGSVFAVAALPAMGANLSQAEKRDLAITGKHSSVAASNAAIRPQAGTAYSVLYSFAGNDGQDPTAEVTLDANGNIYGDTDYGGANSNGTLFELTTGGTETLLHSFGGSGDGTVPDGAMIFDASGNMYGTTESGGSTGNGTIWEYSAGGTYSILHSFASNEGSFIRGRLVMDKQGNLYGTSLFGGANGDGSVFEYSAGGQFTVLHSFNGTDGEFPEHGVTMDKAGNLYGVTAFGGTNGDGSVYEVSNNGTFTSLYSFTGGADGSFLYGGLGIDNKGNLYGATVSNGASGNGTAFEMTPAGALTTLYAFTGAADGGSPEGDTLVVGKKIYGTATTGGANGVGGVYKITQKGDEKLLHSFSSSIGDGYSAGVTVSGKTLYGTTAGGGANGDGVVFSVRK